jgi:protein kinase A/protein kinase X
MSNKQNGSVSRNKISFDSFEILTTLGTGTFGRVRLVKLKGNNNAPAFALKMLKKTVVLKLKQLEHIKSEKSVLERFKHPFIVTLLTTFQDSTFIYMLLEYACGGELFSRIRREGRFANDVGLFYTSEIVLAFEYLHNSNIAYRDLKPENILIDKDGHVKLTDFGFAKYITDASYTLCGTPEYLAPEIIQNEGHNISVMK